MDIAGDRTLRDLLLEQEARNPDATALVCEAVDGSITELTYREFVEQVRRAAAGLAAQGIGRREHVVVHLPNCPEFLFCWFGLAWIGAVLVPSNTANTAGELRHVVQHSEAVAVITAPQFQELLDAVAQDCPQVRTRILIRATAPPEPWVPLAAMLEEPGPAPEPELDSSDVVELLFTSGTTALPKAVMLTHANCLRAGEREWRVSGLEPTDRCLTALPLFHVNAQSVTVLSALTVGATVVVLEEYRASRFWEQVRSHEATCLSLVAMQVRTLLAQPAGEQDATHLVRRVFFAINVSDADKEEFEKRFAVELINGYGLSEAMTLVTASPVHGAKRWPSIGLPTLDRMVRVVAEDGTDAPRGEPGEIVVWGIPGRTLMKGYYKNPEATDEVLRDGWLHTGDTGYFDAAGYLYFFDRRKDVIKSAGENVSATEVENVLLTHPDVAEAAVIAVAHPIRDEVVKAFVVPAAGATLTVEAVVEHCAAQLAKFKVPAEVEFRDELPKTSIGKIEKKLLRQ